MWRLGMPWSSLRPDLPDDVLSLIPEDRIAGYSYQISLLFPASLSEGLINRLVATFV
jgi:hypothetical protein